MIAKLWVLLLIGIVVAAVVIGIVNLNGSPFNITGNGLVN